MTEKPEVTEKPESTEKPGVTEEPDKKEDGDNIPPAVEEKEKKAESGEKAEKPQETGAYNTQPAQSPQTGSHIVWLYAALILTGLSMVILTVFYRKWRKR